MMHLFTDEQFILPCLGFLASLCIHSLLKYLAEGRTAIGYAHAIQCEAEKNLIILQDSYLEYLNGIITVPLSTSSTEAALASPIYHSHLSVGFRHRVDDYLRCMNLLNGNRLLHHDLQMKHEIARFDQLVRLMKTRIEQAETSIHAVLYKDH